MTSLFLRSAFSAGLALAAANKAVAFDGSGPYHEEKRTQVTCSGVFDGNRCYFYDPNTEAVKYDGLGRPQIVNRNSEAQVIHNTKGCNSSSRMGGWFAATLALALAVRRQRS